MDDVVVAQVKHNEIRGGCVDKSSLWGWSQRGEREADIFAEEQSGDGLSDLDEESGIREIVVITQQDNKKKTWAEEERIN